MKKKDLTRVGARGIAAGLLASMARDLEEFRVNAEVAGIHVNERVTEIKDTFTEMAREITSASMDDFERAK